MQLAEQFRPRTLDAVVGQTKAVAKLRALAARGFGGRAYLISGPSGTGKTTLARIVAAHVAGELATVETNAQDCTLDDIREMEREWHQTALPSAPDGPTGRAYIFNECHLMRGAIVSRLLTSLEAIPAHCVVIFTTTTEGMTLFGDNTDALPFASRCVRVQTTGQGFTPAIAEYVRNCAISAGLDGVPLDRYVSKAKDLKGNGRALFHAVETGEL